MKSMIVKSHLKSADGFGNKDFLAIEIPHRNIPMDGFEVTSLPTINPTP